MIRMFGKKPSKDAKLKVKVRETKSPEAGNRLAQGSILEKRRRNRFKVRGGAFASVKSDHYTTGPIRDISRDGFAFEYTSKEKEQHHGPLEVEIFYAGSGDHLRGIPSKTISDLKTEDKALYYNLEIRRCCVQFCELADDQISHLENFIQKYVDRRSGKDRRQFVDPSYCGHDIRSGIERRTSQY